MMAKTCTFESLGVNIVVERVLDINGTPVTRLTIIESVARFTMTLP